MSPKEIFQAAAMAYLNTPYKWGGDDPAGLDCSGLAQEILAIVGLDIPGDQTADVLYRHFLKHGKPVIDTGALAFYGSPDRVTHVGVILEGNLMIEAGGGGSRTLTTTDAWAQNAWVRVRPYTDRKDLVAVLRPDGYPF